MNWPRIILDGLSVSLLLCGGGTEYDDLTEDVP